MTEPVPHALNPERKKQLQEEAHLLLNYSNTWEDYACVLLFFAKYHPKRMITVQVFEVVDQNDLPPLQKRLFGVANDCVKMGFLFYVEKGREKDLKRDGENVFRPVINHVYRASVNGLRMFDTVLYPGHTYVRNKAKINGDNQEPTSPVAVLHPRGG